MMVSDNVTATDNVTVSDNGTVGRTGFEAAGLRKLLRFARPHKAPIIVGIVLGALGSLAALAQPLVVRETLVAVSSGSPVWPVVLVLLAVVLVGAVLTGVQMIVLGRTGERIVLGLRINMSKRLLRLRVREVDRRPMGELLSRAGSDTTLLRSAVNSSVFDAVSGIIMIAGALAVMAYLDWLLLLVVVVALLVVGLGVAPALRRMRLATQSAQEGLGGMTSALERALGAHRTVKASAAEERESELISAWARRAYEAGVRSVKLDAVVGVTASQAVQVSFLIVLAVGGARVAVGAITAADLVAFLLYVMYTASPVIIISTAVTQIQKASAAATRITDVDAMEVEGDDESLRVRTTLSPVPVQSARPVQSNGPPTVRFVNVSFSYRDDVPVFHGLDFEIAANTRVALVGRSGVGKSTIFALLERFYDPDDGEILLGSKDIRELPLDQLRRRIGYVEQDAPIFAGTLRENLLYAAPDADEDDLEHVVAASRLDDLVSRLPDGLDTEVGDRGVQLSGGERQRLALGRLLVRRPRLVLLDEATSQLDSVNELALHNAIDELTKDCTFITIAHRLSTVARSDQVVLLDDGKVRRVGTHESLIAGDTLYRTLAEGQLVHG